MQHRLSKLDLLVNAIPIQNSRFFHSFFYKKTMESLIALNRKVKISNFVLQCIFGTAYVDGDLFVDFFYVSFGESSLCVYLCLYFIETWR